VAITGPISVTLYAASTAPDTDFTAKLVDIEPDGYCANIAEGHRPGAVPQRLRPRGVPRAGRGDGVRDLPLGHGAHVPGEPPDPARGSAAANFPRFDRNLNARRDAGARSAADVQKAVQQIFLDATRPSHLTLPVAS